MARDNGFRRSIKLWESKIRDSGPVISGETIEYIKEAGCGCLAIPGSRRVLGIRRNPGVAPVRVVELYKISRSSGRASLYQQPAPGSVPKRINAGDPFYLISAHILSIACTLPQNHLPLSSNKPLKVSMITSNHRPVSTWKRRKIFADGVRISFPTARIHFGRQFRPALAPLNARRFRRRAVNADFLQQAWNRGG